ncbi:hypothetical protein CYMTET_24048, partial [Cymbomonas tetramitiformis]
MGVLYYFSTRSISEGMRRSSSMSIIHALVVLLFSLQGFQPAHSTRFFDDRETAAELTVRGNRRLKEFYIPSLVKPAGSTEPRRPTNAQTKGSTKSGDPQHRGFRVHEREFGSQRQEGADKEMDDSVEEGDLRGGLVEAELEGGAEEARDAGGMEEEEEEEEEVEEEADATEVGGDVQDEVGTAESGDGVEEDVGTAGGWEEVEEEEDVGQLRARAVSGGLDALSQASKATSVERRTSYIHCSPAPEPLPGWHRPVQMDSLGEGGSFPAADHRCAALAEHITVHEAARVMRGCPVAGSQIYSECTFHNLGYSPSEGSLIGFRDQGGAVNSAPHWKVPGFGVERRHFPPTGGKVGESWGTAAAQPLEVRLVNSNAAVQCTRWVRDVAYLVHVFKQHSVWHTLESLFRVFQAYEQRQLRGTTLVLLNVESLRKLKGSTLELYEAFGLDVLTRAELAKETVCFAEAVAVGFPHHSLARPTANASTVDAFRSLFLDHWNLTAAYMETRAFRRPAVTVLSDSPSQATSKTASDRAYIANAEGLAALLHQELGWDVNVESWQRLSVSEQAASALVSTVLVAPSSAAMHNALWMLPGTALLQIHPPGGPTPRPAAPRPPSPSSQRRETARCGPEPGTSEACRTGPFREAPTEFGEEGSENGRRVRDERVMTQRSLCSFNICPCFRSRRLRRRGKVKLWQAGI